MFSVIHLGRTENINEEIKVSCGFRTMSVFFSLLVLKTVTTLIQPLFKESLLSSGIFSFIFRSLISSSPFLLIYAILQTTEVIALQLACFVVLMQNLMRCDTLPSL